MHTDELIRSLRYPLGSIPLVDLETLRARLDQERSEHAARLAVIERRKNELFFDGVSRSNLRGQRARALQIQVLDAEAEQIATLLRIIHKQRLLLNRLIWLRESLDALGRLQSTTSVAIPVGWLGLLNAAQDMPDEDNQLDQLNRELRDVSDAYFAESQQPAGFFQEGTDSTGFVVRVLDGGSIELASGQRVRYIGVDSPLLHNALGQVDVGALAARDANRRLVAHKRVRLVSDRLNADPDMAWWRYVYVDDLLVNAALLRQGVVLHLSRYPNTRLEADLLAAEREAKRHRRGLWKSGRIG